MRASKMLFLSLVGTVLGVFGAGANAAAADDCARVEFSAEVLERFPNIASACHEVIVKDGQEFAVIRGDLIRTDRNALFVRVRHPDGTRGRTQRIPVSSDFRVMIDGNAVRVEDVAVGQQLTAYVKVTEPVIAPRLDVVQIITVPLEPETVAPVELTAAVAAPPMPRTASLVPALGVAGVLLLALGLALGWRRAEVRVGKDPR